MSIEHNKTLVPHNINELKPYVAGKTIQEVVEEYNPTQISKLASNENRLGRSEKVEGAVQDALKIVHDYPDPLSKRLRLEIAGKLGVELSNVMVGSGSESILAGLCRTFFNNRENLVTADATFIGVFVQAKIRGIKLKKIPLTNGYRFDLKGMLNAIDEHTKMIYIANPNNPTGTYVNKEEFEWFMKEVPNDVLVIMDEAYYEYASSNGDYPDVLSYGFENVVVLRTFSKAYGLAGFRVGYAVANEEIIQYLIKTKLAFEPGTLGQAAAEAAFKDSEFLERGMEIVQRGKEDLYSYFDEKGIGYVRSLANFVMMTFDTEEEAIYFTDEMLKKGVILRRINAFGLPNCVRVTIGLPSEMKHFKESLEVVLGK
ncbi:MAG: histidinol-phosphate transaminase [Balneolaceae bacterium]